MIPSYEFIGITGMLILLIAFFLNIFKILSVDSRKYNALNVVACTLLLIYAGILKSIPFLILNTLWGTASLIKLFHLVGEHEEMKKSASKRTKTAKKDTKKTPKIYKEKYMKK